MARRESAAPQPIKKIVARAQRADAQRVSGDVPQISLKVTEDTLTADLRADRVAVHLHGHDEYKGKYWLLRRKAGRGEKRETLAQGTPERLAELVQRLGYTLCLEHRAVNCQKEHES